jgi:hypothetical protein
VKDVFPPEMGKCSQNLARVAEDYHAQTALDMGCGSGYLVLALKHGGVPVVWAADVHSPAVKCVRRYAAMNAEFEPVHVVKSDLLENIPVGLKFDLIVFNQPFGHGQGDTVCGCGPSGWRLSDHQAIPVTGGGAAESRRVVMMAFSEREPVENSPDRVAAGLGFPVRILLHAYYGDANNYIYEIHSLEKTSPAEGGESLD